MLWPEAGPGRSLVLESQDGSCNEYIDTPAARLQTEGAQSFAKSWNELITLIASESADLKKAGVAADKTA